MRFGAPGRQQALRPQNPAILGGRPADHPREYGGKADALCRDLQGQISALYAAIRPAIDRAGGAAVRAAQINALVQARLLAESSPVIRERVKEGSSRLAVPGAYYNRGTGRVTSPLDASNSRTARAELPRIRPSSGQVPRISY